MGETAGLRSLGRIGLGLLIAVFILVAWASLRMHRGDTRSDRYRMAMRSALYNLRDAQTDYHARTGAYSADIGELGLDTVRSAIPEGVELEITVSEAPSGWRAETRHQGLPPDDTCTMSGVPGGAAPPECSF